MARAKGQEVEADESWDLYALGILAFEVFSGKVTTTPQTEITRQTLDSLPTPKAIMLLLENGQNDNAPGMEQIATVMNEELREKGIEPDLAFSSEATSLVTSLGQEIRQLQQDLAAKQGKTEYSDIVNYLSRMGLVFTVHTKAKRAQVNFSTHTIRRGVVVIDASDDNLLRLASSDLRFIKGKNTEVLKALNVLTWNASLIRVAHDYNDGEIRLSVHAPHGYTAISFQEFQALFYTFVHGAELLCKALDAKFGKGRK